MADIAPFIVRIQTALEKGGIDAAKAELAGLAEEARKAKEEAGKTGGATQSLGQSAQRAAGLTGNLSNALSQGGPAAQKMGAGLRTLGAVIPAVQGGIVGLATVGLAAAINGFLHWHRKVKESQEVVAKWRESLHENFRKAQEARVDKIGSQFDELRKSIDAAADAQNRLSAAQASADNAQKAARLAEITLREKLEQAGLKDDDAVGAAKVTARFAQERRALEEEYSIIDAQRETDTRARALETIEARLSVTEREIASGKQTMDDMRTRLEKIATEKGRLEALPAPTVRAMTTSTSQWGGEPTYIDVPDERAAKERSGRIGQLAATEKSLEKSFEKAGEALVKLIDQRAAQEVERRAATIEREAARTGLQTAMQITPQINAAEADAERRNIGSLTAQRNASLFRGRIESVRRSAEINAQSRATQAEQFDSRSYRGLNRATSADAQRIDRSLDADAAKARQLLETARQLEATVKAMDPDALTRAFGSVQRKLDQLDKAIKDMDARAKRPGSGG